MRPTPTMMTHETTQMSQNRFHIAGHSLKKCESCLIQPHPVEMLRLGKDAYLDLLDGGSPLHVVASQVSEPIASVSA